MQVLRASPAHRPHGRRFETEQGSNLRNTHLSSGWPDLNLLRTRQEKPEPVGLLSRKPRIGKHNPTRTKVRDRTGLEPSQHSPLVGLAGFEPSPHTSRKPEPVGLLSRKPRIGKHNPTRTKVRDRTGLEPSQHSPLVGLAGFEPSPHTSRKARTRRTPQPQAQDRETQPHTDEGSRPNRARTFATLTSRRAGRI